MNRKSHQDFFGLLAIPVGHIYPDFKRRADMNRSKRNFLKAFKRLCGNRHKQVLQQSFHDALFIYYLDYIDANKDGRDEDFEQHLKSNDFIDSFDFEGTYYHRYQYFLSTLPRFIKNEGLHAALRDKDQFMKIVMEKTSGLEEIDQNAAYIGTMYTSDMMMEDMVGDKWQRERERERERESIIKLGLDL